MHRRFLYLALAIMITLATLHSPAQAGDQKWSLLDGRIRLDVPASWRPMTAEETVKCSYGPTQLQGGLLAPDGVTGLGLALTALPDTLPDTAPDIQAIKADLQQWYAEQGWDVAVAEVTRISNQSFVILHCHMNRAGLPLVNLVAATPLDGQLLVIPFLATGRNTEEVLLPLQLALVSLEIVDVSVSPELGGDVRLLPLVETAVPVAASGQMPVGRPRTIPGSGITLDVPDAFLQAMLVPGYYSPDGRAGLYVTTSGLPYSPARHFLDRAVLSRQGMELKEVETLEIDGRPATLCRVTYNSESGSGQTLLMLVGDHEKSRLIHAQMSPGAPLGIKPVLRSALLSVTWDPSRDKDHMEGLGFTVSETQSLKVLCRAHDRLVLTTAGSRVPLDRNNPYAVVSISGLGQAVDSLPEVATWWTQNVPTFTDFKEESRKSRMFGDHDGFEIIGTVVDNQTKKKRDFYQALIRVDRMYCVVQGFMNAYAATDLIPEFEQIAASLQLHPAGTQDREN